MFKKKSDSPAMPTADADPAAPKSKSGFLATPLGKVIAALLALSTLGAIITLVVLAVGFYMGESVLKEVIGGAAEEVIGGMTPTPAPGEETQAEAAQPAAYVPNGEVFVFRNVFVPLVQASSGTTGTASTPASTVATDPVTPTDPNTLYVTGMVTEGGITKVKLSLNNITYTLAAGESIPGTSWKVVSISGSSVALTYGTIPVTLSVGQGIRK